MIEELFVAAAGESTSPAVAGRVRRAVGGAKAQNKDLIAVGY